MENNEGVFLDGGLKIEAKTSKWQPCLHQKKTSDLNFKASAMLYMQCTINNEINIMYHNCLI